MAAGYGRAQVLSLSILSSGSGDVLAALSVEASLQVEQVQKQLAEATTDYWRAYQLLHGARALQPSERLADIFGEALEGTLVAVKQPLLRISCPCEVLSAGFLPESQDLLLVTKGNITSFKDDEVKVLGDDVDSPVFWFWRLRSSDAWSLEKATLLARTWPLASNKLLQQVWEEEKDAEIENYSPWSKEEVEEQKRSGIIKLSAKITDSAAIFMRVHDESYAVFSWNQSDYFGGCGFLERLELETGKVSRLGGLWDAWDIATDPSGQCFYTSCYDGTDVHRIAATVTEPSTERNTQILSQAVGLKFHLCYDASLKVLVASGGEGGCFLLAPPGQGSGVMKMKGAEVAQSIRPDNDDHTPGDKTSPWETVKMPLPEKKSVDDVRGFYADNGCLTFVDKETGQVCMVDLFKGTSELIPSDSPVQYVARCGELLAIFTASWPACDDDSFL